MEAERGYKVYPIQRRLQENLHCRGHYKPYDQLKSEPHVAHKLDEKERFMRVGLSLVQSPESDIMPEVPDGHISYDWHSTVGMRLQTEGED